MAHETPLWPENPAELYPLLCQQMDALALPSPLPTLANASALLWSALDGINWAGFYLRKGEMLLLGPFQGKVACTEIPFGRGVCGTAAATRKVQLVPDVHAFPGHIACDSASRSEIVIPLIKDGELLGVLDIDSPHLARFDETDANGLSDFCSVIMAKTDWSGGLL